MGVNLSEAGGRSGASVGESPALAVHRSAILNANRTTKAARRHQMAMMMTTTNHLVVLEALGPIAIRAFSRHSAVTCLGTILMANAAPSGTMTRSSRIPRTGMKSGIRSIGLAA
jgi:hypothetical protein